MLPRAAQRGHARSRHEPHRCADGRPCPLTGARRADRRAAAGAMGHATSSAALPPHRCPLSWMASTGERSAPSLRTRQLAAARRARAAWALLGCRRYCYTTIGLITLTDFSPAGAHAGAAPTLLAFLPPAPEPSPAPRRRHAAPPAGLLLQNSSNAPLALAAMQWGVFLAPTANYAREQGWSLRRTFKLAGCTPAQAAQGERRRRQQPAARCPGSWGSGASRRPLADGGRPGWCRSRGSGRADVDAGDAGGLPAHGRAHVGCGGGGGGQQQQQPAAQLALQQARQRRWLAAAAADHGRVAGRCAVGRGRLPLADVGDAEGRSAGPQPSAARLQQRARLPTPLLNCCCCCCPLQSPRSCCSAATCSPLWSPGWAGWTGWRWPAPCLRPST